MTNPTQKIARSTRLYRKLHKWAAVPLFVFMFLIGGTGLLLGWKKHMDFLPPTQKGQSADPATWLSLDQMQLIARAYMADSLDKPNEIDRIDIRPGKGIAKFRFEGHYTEIQLDCQTGAILSVAQRNSDLIEQIHDGSLMDDWLGTSNGQLKLGYTTLASLGLMLLSVSGFFLWYNPKRIKKRKSVAEIKD